MNNIQNQLVASILICTRNRAVYIGNTIREAAAQSLSIGSFEIVVVDNGSTDHTPEVVRECQGSITNVPLRYVVETEVGLSAARNLAIREAKGRILCFLDDDALPEIEWLEWLVRGYAGNPKVMCVGGAIVPVYEIPLPEWFPEDLEFIFKPALRGVGLHQVTYPHYPYGANFSIRADAAQVGKFNTSLGYKAQSLIPCEETEFLLRLEKAGYTILMETRAVVKHLIPANRLTLEYQRRRHYANGRGNALMNYMHCSESDKKNAILSLIVNNVRLHVKFLRMRVRNLQKTQPGFPLQQCRLAEDLGYSDQECKIVMAEIMSHCKKVLPF